jgi:hypothetical protein
MYRVIQVTDPDVSTERTAFVFKGWKVPHFKAKVLRLFETSGCINPTTQRNVPQGQNFVFHRLLQLNIQLTQVVLSVLHAELTRI